MFTKIDSFEYVDLLYCLTSCNTNTYASLWCTRRHYVAELGPAWCIEMFWDSLWTERGLVSVVAVDLVLLACSLTEEWNTFENLVLYILYTLLLTMKAKAMKTPWKKEIKDLDWLLGEM